MSGERLFLTPVDLLVELCAIRSETGDERAMADRIGAELTALGLAWDEDGAGAAIGCNAGNLYCRLEATGPGTPLFFCAHLDTVPPVGALTPVVDDGRVRNTGGTILGSDNKAAIVAMLEAVRRIVADGRPHGGIELLFTVAEETGLHGANAFDVSRLVAKHGYVYDQGAPIGEIVLGAPGAFSIQATIQGRASHAGMAPEEGRSAIAAASRAIAEMRLGRVDEVTTANVGVITGGTARNIVPELCTFQAEARSHDEGKLAALVQEMLDAITFAADAGECTAETVVTRQYHAYRFSPDDRIVRLARAAFEKLGIPVVEGLSGGAADANVFNLKGLSCLNLANGMMEIHTPDEWIAAEDVERMVDVTLAIVELACEG
ncbi:MAG: M20/M25/M40 family metallo-hydrolase [Gaiellales bacterium]